VCMGASHLDTASEVVCLKENWAAGAGTGEIGYYYNSGFAKDLMKKVGTNMEGNGNVDVEMGGKVGIVGTDDGVVGVGCSSNPYLNLKECLLQNWWDH
jgi:hypothetical protein